MRQLFTAVFVLVLLALNWVAIHDILEGEPNVWMEWTFVIGSAFLLAVYWFRKTRHAG